MQRSITKGARSKSHKKDEDLRGQVRELKKENSALRSRLKQLEKNRHIWEQYNLDADENHQEEKTADPAHTCPSCDSGILLLIDLGIKHLWTCSSCTYRKTTIKNG